MVQDVILPKLGLTMSRGTIVRWHKNIGEKVAPGDALFDFETDKAQSTVNSEVSGVLVERLFGEGDEADVLQTVCRVGEQDSLAQSAEKRIQATPMARKLAAKYGLELAMIRPARGGRIEQADVEAAMAAMDAAEACDLPVDRELPIDEPMAAERFEPAATAQISPLNAWVVDVDMERMLALCALLERAGEEKPMDRLIRRAVSLASAQCDVRVVLHDARGSSADLRIACSGAGEWVLSMSRIAERPMAKAGRVVPAPTLCLAMACGEPGTREREADEFLPRLKLFLETPELFIAQ